MFDMAKTPEEAKEDTKPSPATVADVNKYPYGLCLSLDEDQLDKLDLDKPDVGDMCHLFGIGRVTNVSEHEKADGSVCCRVELQITHLGVECEDDEEGED
jgi:hypothetical protein